MRSGKIVQNGYVVRRTVGGTEKKYRNWWLIKSVDNDRYQYGILQLGNILLPDEYVGKKVKVKLEIIE